MVKLDLAKVAKEGCKEEGLVGLIFNTIGVRYERIASEQTNVTDADVRLLKRCHNHGYRWWEITIFGSCSWLKYGAGMRYSLVCSPRI